MSINLSNFGKSHTNTLKTRKITNDEGNIVNPEGIDIYTSNNKIQLRAETELNISVTSGDMKITDTDIDITNDTNGILLNNNTFINKNNLVLDTKTTGGVYLNKQDFTTDTSGDWKIRVDTNNDLVIESYNGSSWDIKLKLNSN